MTMFKPNLAVEHVSIFAKGRSVYSEDFHRGLNIIRGENSSGKSTIMDFIFYGLGGDFQENQWRESALRCDSVMLGVALNGSSVTLSRDIEAKALRSMRIYVGGWQEAIASAAAGWEVYPYSRNGRDSFSQVLFRFLGLPEVQHENQTTKITMNQILRLLYSDQLSSVEKIFRQLTFDDALTRQSVGDLLCGAYSDKFYRARIRRREAENEAKDVAKRQQTLVRFHGKSGHPLTREWVDQEQRNVEKRIDGINAHIETLEAGIFEAQFVDRLTLSDQEKNLSSVIDLQKRLGDYTEKLRRIEFEITDSEDFIDVLSRKVDELHDSGAVVEQFSNLSFQFCPSCMSALNAAEPEHCKLCKEPYDHQLTKKRSLRLLNEYQRQLQQSSTLQAERREEATELETKIHATRDEWQRATKAYSIAVRTPTTEMRLKLRELNRDAGYANRELEDLALKREVIEELANLADQLDKINVEIRTLDETIRSEANRTREQISKARQRIEWQALDILKRDLERQVTFKHADKFDFQFDGDRMSVNGESFFSASSMAYMRNSFFAAFLFAAADDVSFSHPRFLLMDTVEDKGMEEERSQNFQRILADKSSKAVSEHQIIIATSMIAPDLDIPRFTVGERYTHENRTLDFSNG